MKHDQVLALRLCVKTLVIPSAARDLLVDVFCDGTALAVP